ncbi:MAG: flagellar export chaperone FliS [Leptospiraceae bacterium]|nr:flagellar export chaperone FliS [Leptospiraceae bacterium]
MSLVRKSSGTSGYNSYKANEISTVNQGKLIVMLYEGSIRFLNLAIENMEPRTYDVVNVNIIKCQDIISELMSSLNMDRGGKMASDLLSIYIYIKRRLLEANINKDKKILQEIKGYLSNLKTAWDEIAKNEGNTRIPTPTVADPSKGSRLSIQG